MRSPACAARSTRSRVPAAWSAPRDISEFAWAIENLLNKIIENTLQRSPAILATIRDASAIAGELVNALEAGQAAPAKAQDIIDRAHALAANKGRPGRADRDHGNSRAHARYAP